MSTPKGKVYDVRNVSYIDVRNVSYIDQYVGMVKDELRLANEYRLMGYVVHAENKYNNARSMAESPMPKWVVNRSRLIAEALRKARPNGRGLAPSASCYGTTKNAVIEVGKRNAVTNGAVVSDGF